MNMKCAICGSDKFHLDIENQTVSCSACSFYCDFKALVRDNAAPKAQSALQRPAYNPADFDIVGGVLKKYKGAAVDVVVPDGVVVIGERAFEYLQYIESVHLPEGIKKIEDFAFRGCERMKLVKLPSTLIEIRQLAFYGCKKLGKITLPENLKTIGLGAFAYCENLESITIPKSVEQIGLSYGGTNAFEGCNKLSSITYPTGGFSIDTFKGSLFYRRHPDGQKQLVREKKCPNCMGDLNVLKRCKNCGMSW